jgi:hypothetical protein
MLCLHSGEMVEDLVGEPTLAVSGDGGTGVEMHWFAHPPPPELHKTLLVVPVVCPLDRRREVASAPGWI